MRAHEQSRMPMRRVRHHTVPKPCPLPTSETRRKGPEDCSAPQREGRDRLLPNTACAGSNCEIREQHFRQAPPTYHRKKLEACSRHHSGGLGTVGRPPPMCVNFFAWGTATRTNLNLPTAFGPFIALVRRGTPLLAWQPTLPIGGLCSNMQAAYRLVEESSGPMQSGELLLVPKCTSAQSRQAVRVKRGDNAKLPSHPFWSSRSPNLELRCPLHKSTPQRQHLPGSPCPIIDFCHE